MTAIAEETPRTTQQNIAISGVVDLADGRGFLRTAGYRRSAEDIPITQAQVRQHGLRAGDQIEGTAGTRQGRTQQARTQQDKTQQDKTLLTVESVNGLPAAEARHRPSFDALTPVYPNQRFRLEDGDPSRTARIIDLVSPIGKGQRGLIVAPPKAGKTTVLKTIAHAIATAYPEVHLMLVLVGERPEEVTDLRRTVRGEVIASTFDQSPSDHIKAAELAIERAKRLAELGRDVVVMLDSLTRLGRAYNLAAPASSRTLTGGVAVSALQPPRQFLGAARCLEEGGSLTIHAIGTAAIVPKVRVFRSLYGMRRSLTSTFPLASVRGVDQNDRKRYHRSTAPTATGINVPLSERAGPWPKKLPRPQHLPRRFRSGSGPQ